MRVHVVRDGLEAREQLLRLVDDALVAQHRAVVREVDGRRLGGVLLRQALRLGVALAEGLQGGDGFCGRG